MSNHTLNGSSLQPPTLRPIETVYNQYRFRSRLEARWAVFFDALGIEYDYEVEGYETEAGCYLPDFEIAAPIFQLLDGDEIWTAYGQPNHFFIEVKPNRLATNLAQLHSLVDIAIGYSAALIIFGTPGKYDMFALSGDKHISGYGHAVRARFGMVPTQMPDLGSDTVLCNAGLLCFPLNVASHHILTIEHWENMKPIKFAIKTARYARFERGETPDPNEIRPNR